MSANSWIHCPACEKRRLDQLAVREAEVNAAYGKVEAFEFDRMRAELEDARSHKTEPTFREDWDIYGAAEGTVHVSYSGGCTECGASVSFEVDRPVAMGDGS